MLQPVLGILADRMFKADRKHAPIFPDMVHWLLGYCLIGLALIECYLGLAMYCVSTTTIGLFVAAVIVAAFAFLLFDAFARFTVKGAPLLQAHSGGLPPPLLIGAIAVGVLLAVLTIAAAAFVSKGGADATDAFYAKCRVSSIAGSSRWWPLFVVTICVSAVCIVIALIMWWCRRSGHPKGKHVLNL